MRQMKHGIVVRSPIWATSPVYRVLTAFPITCFSLTLATDVAYWRTSNLLWLHFSEWLLLVGLVFGILAALFLLVVSLLRRVGSSWMHALGGIVVLLLATLNSLIHTADGWTAVMPYGLVTSIATVLAMIFTSFVGGRRRYHD
jgi:uncharacterized membrane protein